MIVGKMKFGVALFLATTSLSGFAQAQDWTGGYVGLEGGFGSTNWQLDFTGPAIDSASVSGLILGVEAGYYAQLDNNLVIGFAGDWSFSTINGGSGPNPKYIYDINSFATAQIKFGVTTGATNQTLLYLSGGAMLADVGYTNVGTSSGRKNYLGYVVGAGVEHMLTEAVSLKAEVSYFDAGKGTFNSGEVVKLNGILGAVGVNFHF